MKPKIVTVVPCYRAEKTVMGIIEDIKKTRYEGDSPYIVTVIDGELDNTFDQLWNLQKTEGVPEVILKYKENRGKTGAMRSSLKYLIGEDPEVDVLEAKEAKNPEIFTYIDSDGQQRFDELFNNIGLPLLEGVYDFGHIERRQPIKCP